MLNNVLLEYTDGFIYKKYVYLSEWFVKQLVQNFIKNKNDNNYMSEKYIRINFTLDRKVHEILKERIKNSPYLTISSFLRAKVYEFLKETEHENFTSWI